MKRSFKNKLLNLMVLPMLVLSLIGVAPAYAAGNTYDLDVSGTYNFVSGDPAMDIATGLTATSNPAGGTVDGARVVIGTGFQSGDMLSATNSGGVTSSYNSSNGVLTLSGTVDVSVYQTVLQSVKFSTTSTTVGQRTITYSLGSSVPFDGNGHYYMFVSSPLITWTDAKTAAETSTYFGMTGYLATIADAGANENAFATNKLNGQGAWLGGSDAAVEGEWRWVTGPEAGTLFCTDTNPQYGGCTDGGNYDNWADTQPDNAFLLGSNEHYLQFQAGQNGQWNDLPNSGSTGFIQGYVVEYGGMPGDVATAMDISGNVTVDVVDVNYTVTFDANGGTGAMSDQVAYQPTALTANAFTLAGYSFSGWNTAANGTGTAYANSATYAFDANVTLYAQWKIVPLIVKSVGVNDGWVLEYTENSNDGGFIKWVTDSFTVGDDAADRQYRSFLHFDTSALPDNAVITSVVLRLREVAITGSDPYLSLGQLRIDMAKPAFGAPGVEFTDFEAVSPRVNVGIVTEISPSLFSSTLNNAARNYINKTGSTQLRLYFTTDDNDNSTSDFIRFFSGEAASEYRPKLIITYTIP